MRNQRSLMWLNSLLLASAAAVTACGDAGPASPPTFPAQLATDLQASLDKSVAAGVAPGVALFVSHPEHGSWAGAAGLGDIGQGQAMLADGHFRAGSTLKVLVATAVLQQVESHKLELGATLTELLPTAMTTQIARANEIDVRMLLSHRSGIPEFLGPEMLTIAAVDQAHIWTVDDFLTYATKNEPTGAPGASYSYSNTNYVLLGEILRMQTGKDWRDVVTENVIKRAKMTASSLPLPGDRAVPAPVNRGYMDLGDGMVDFTGMDPSMADASGGHALITTPADLTTFLRALMAGELFDNPGTLSQMLTFLPAAEAPGNPQTEYGLGIAVTEIGGGRFIGHLGRTAGYWGFTWYAPKTGYYVTGSMNQDADLGAFALPIAKLLSE